MTRSVFNHRRQPSRTLISSDTFNRSSPIGSTDGSGTADPATWTSQAGNTADITTNKADFQTAALGIAYVDLATADVDISLDVTCSAVGGLGSAILFRYTNSSNYWFWMLNAATNFQLWKRVSGSNSQVGSNISGGSASQNLRVVASGSNISVYKGGSTTASITTTDSFNSTATKHGFYQQSLGGGSPTFDNWTVYTP